MVLFKQLFYTKINVLNLFYDCNCNICIIDSASEGKSVEEDQGNRKDELPKLERQESKMTLRSVCECFEEDADE